MKYKLITFSSDGKYLFTFLSKKIKSGSRKQHHVKIILHTSIKWKKKQLRTINTKYLMRYKMKPR